MNYAGIPLIILGAACMAAEAVVPSAGVLGVIGAILFLWGAAMLSGSDYFAFLGLNLDFDPVVVWGVSVFALAVLGVAVFLSLKAYRKPAHTGTESMVGAEAKVIEWNGKKGRVLIQGETWRAESDTPLDLKKDDAVTVEKVEELVLKVKADR